MDCSAITLNLNKVCRVCLTENDDMHSVFSQISSEECAEEACYLYQILMSISSLKIDAEDGLPSSICSVCMGLAHTAFKFQQQCNRAQEILQTFLSQTLNSSESSGNIQINEDISELLVTDSLHSNQNEQCDGILNGNEAKAEKFKQDDGCSAATENKVSLSLPLKQERVHFNYYVKSNGEKVYFCNLCSKVYKYSSSLKIHMRTHTQERPYVCTFCGKDFKQHGSLTYHHRSHTGERPHVCKVCGKRYRQQGSLTAHMRVHTGQRPFLCSVCGRGFRQAPDLGYHMRTHTKERPYMCTICGKTMSMQCHLVQHMRTHTGERPFQCSECNKAFPSSTRLKRHAIIHTGLKPYTCEVCTKSFNRRSSLRVHSKIHTDDRRHVCPVCSKGFIQAHTLKTHLLTHSSEQLEELKVQSSN